MENKDEAILQRKFITAESVILGLLLGGLLILVSYLGQKNSTPLVRTPVSETIWVALYLTAVVSFCSFKLPTLFTSRPRLAYFTLSMLCGHVSLFFDSFAVILLLNTITMLPFPAARFSHRFNAFCFKAICAFNALTVGGGFYIGELWGLPYFISSGMDNAIAGFPLLLVLTPYCLVTSLLVARFFPVKIEPVKMDRGQLVGAAEIVFFLSVIIITHQTFLSLGLLLLYSVLKKETFKLVHNLMHELRGGAANALGLIMVAWLIQQIPGTTQWFASKIQGGWIFVLSSISSPFAGAMVAGAETPGEFYRNISLLMLGAPMFVSSSLVAIIVFRDTLAWEDLPKQIRWLASKKEGVLQEAVAYTLLVLPLVITLGGLLYLANSSGLFVAAYSALAALVPV